MLGNLWSIYLANRFSTRAWIYAYKLKGKGIWILKIPCDCRDCVGLNGSWAWEWEEDTYGGRIDSWHPFGLLVKEYGPRIFHHTGPSTVAKVADVIRANNWAWPAVRSDYMADVISAVCRTIFSDWSAEEIMLYKKIGSDGKYSVRSAWDFSRLKGSKLDCISWSGDHFTSLDTASSHGLKC